MFRCDGARTSPSGSSADATGPASFGAAKLCHPATSSNLPNFKPFKFKYPPFKSPKLRSRARVPPRFVALLVPALLFVLIGSAWAPCRALRLQSVPQPVQDSPFPGASSKEYNALKAKLSTLAKPNPCSVSVGPNARYKKVQDAVNAVGQNSRSTPKTVCVGSGVFREQVTIAKGQDGITLQGQGINTVITGSKSAAQTGGNPYYPATVTVLGNFFTAQNLVIQNEYSSITSPSPAVTIRSDVTTWRSVGLLSWDDTLAVRGGSSHLVTSSHVSGLTDVTWGFGRIAFVGTTVFVRFWYEKNTVYTGDVATFGTDPSNAPVQAGALYEKCTITGEGKTQLGRPYRAVSTAVFSNCRLDGNVVGDGWGDYLGNIKKKQFVFREYNSSGQGARNSRKYGQVFKGPTPLQYTVKNFIGRTS